MFFIRHNGGSVWVDELGWPWPEHGCFAAGEEKAATWIRHFRAHRPKSPADARMGIVIQSQWTRADEDRPLRILLAIDCGNLGQFCLATKPINTADYFIGQVVVLNLERNELLLSSGQGRDIMNVNVSPIELGLAGKWRAYRARRHADA